MSIKITVATQFASNDETPSCTWPFERARELLNRFGFNLDPNGGAFRASDILKALDANRDFDLPDPFDRIKLRFIAATAFAIGADALVLACTA